jgi:hypothetical protein
MALCQRYSSLRLARILAHCSDMCSVDLAGHHEHGNVPRDLRTPEEVSNGNS